MGKKRMVTAILAIALVFTLTVVGCDNGSTEGNQPKTVTYQSTDTAGFTYILVITEKGSTAAAGDSYVLTIKKTGQSDKVSKGAVSAVGADGTLTLQPNNSGSDTFSVSVSGGNMTEISGDITLENGESVTAPGTLAPEESGGNDVITDGWEWDAYNDDSNGGTSSITMIQGTGNDRNKVTFAGNVNIISDQGYGYAGWNAVPNAGNLTALKNEETFSIKCKGDADICTVQVITSNIDDWCYYRTTFYVSETERTIAISYDDLVQPSWGVQKPFNKNLITNIEFLMATGDRGEGPFKVTMWDLQVGGEGVSTRPEVFTSIDDMAAWLSAQPANTKNDPYIIALKNSSYIHPESLGPALKANNTKYVFLDLSNTASTLMGMGGDDGFRDCLNLVGIILPNHEHFYEIESDAFSGCTSLTTVIIPKKVDRIGYGAFSWCISLVRVSIPADILGGSGYIVIDHGAFINCISLAHITIPAGVTEIGGRAFYGCASLTSITIPDRVTNIGQQAFNMCVNLTSVTFQGTIPSSGLFNDRGDGDYPPFLGDLREKYLAGGIGTYTTTAPVSDSSVWVKQ